MKLKIFILTALLIIGLGVALPSQAADSEKEVKAAVAVAATVPSKLCPQYSSVISNVNEILADNSQKALITVKIFDCSNVGMEAINVKVTSNRGEIDNITPVTSDGVPITPISPGETITDENGFVFFEISSRVPGEALFSTLADHLVSLNQIKMTFLPLPFQRIVTVTVEVPKFLNKEGKITLFQPKQQEIDKEKLVNLGVEFIIPEWVFYIIIINAGLNILLLMIIIFLIIWVRIAQRKEIGEIEETEEILKKEEQEIKDITDSAKP